MFGQYEASIPLLKSTYEEICMRVKFMFEQASPADQFNLGDVIEAYLSLQGHIFRKWPFIAVDNPNVDFIFVFKLGNNLISIQF
jgi:hypothetical protein